MTRNNKQQVEYSKKLPPAKFAGKNWTYEEDSICLSNSATLTIPLPQSQKLYFMAEVCLPPANNGPQQLTISVGGVTIEKWTVVSSIIYDKLAIIPPTVVSANGNTDLEFKLLRQSSSAPLSPDKKAPEVCLKSISIATNLDAYLNELQNGFDWVCSLREQLLRTIDKVLFYINFHENEYPSAINKLERIIKDPYVLENHQEKIIFDLDYFESHFKQLKEGEIHQEIRSWAKTIQHLEKNVISLGNHATRRKDLQCFSGSELKRQLDPHITYNEKIRELREANETLNNLEIILGKDAINSVPSTLYLDITNVCNFRCRMCYQSKSNFLQTSLINEHMAEVIKMMPFLDDITIAGLGEPLLGRNLEIFSDFAKRLKCTTSIITNGSLINKNIDRLKNFSKVSISFDGATPKTFETLRHGSNFNQIYKNIKLLRKEALQLNIAFSVVVSRANLDELADIVKLAAELGVNQINLTPMEHIKELQLKASDILLFQKGIEQGYETAKANGISIANSVTPEAFQIDYDTPREKNNLLTLIDSLATRQEETFNLKKLSDNLEACEFSYYPSPIVFRKNRWPKLQENNINHKETHQPAFPPSHHFKIDETLSEIRLNISKLSEQIKESGRKQFIVPYCLDPWKLNYIKSNGNRRLCCHVDIEPGTLQEGGFKNSLNSPDYKKIRKSMLLNDEELLPACQKCRAKDKLMGIESLQRTCDFLDISLVVNQI